MPRVQIVYDTSGSTSLWSGGNNPFYDPYYKGYTFDADQSNEGGGRNIFDYLDRRSKSVVIDGDAVVPRAPKDPGPPRTIYRQAGSDRPKVDFNSKRDEQKLSGRLFEDPDFPADNRSIYPSRSYSRFEWKRPKEICSDPLFISDGVSRFDVKQGELGDCWLLAAVASLSMHKKLFDQVVVPDQDFGANYCGMFRFRFWQFGEWKDVEIDDRLPTKYGKLCFMRSEDRNEFWSALLEKAYAKLNGSYEALSGGNQAEAMVDFTGGLCETFDMRRAPPNLYNIMVQANNACSLMGCAIESEQLEGHLSNGLITGHAYSVTDVKKVRLNNGMEESLVRVRNPWGNECEWKGDWSDHSHKWSSVSQGEKDKLGMDQRDDGEFWMSYKDFSSHFNKIEICHLGPESMSSSVKGEAAKKRRWEMCLESGQWKRNVSAGGCRNNIDSFHMNEQFRIEIVDPDEDDDENMGTIIVGLMQKDIRKILKGADFLTIGYAIYSIKDPNIPPLDQKFFRFTRQVDKSPSFVNQREVCGRHKLPPGHYVIIPSTFSPNEEAEFILRIFSEKPNESGVLDTPNRMDNVVDGVYGRKHHNTVMENEEPLKKAFMEFAGSMAKIHAKQLQQILNRSFGREIKEFQGFSLEACRSMLALVDANMSGFMEFDEFKHLWNEIRLLKTIFKEYDADGNGYFDSFELRGALRVAGYNLCNKVFESVAMRYMDPEQGRVCFEDFILLSIRLKTAFETYKAMPKTNEGFGVVKQDHFLLQTLYL
ncbi:hypothetical protein BOX15_Mlig013791g1 [Macrostomum lignano]|uniref:Calpain catalytic domain-containing protein n=2 Tax=Macrostomum lignano TaxID=282301 RepID=A0A267GW14_9PLAT|nr:hypothetical protein BOX15_Mlig013791g1 [Macrostomum lignano]